MAARTLCVPPVRPTFTVRMQCAKHANPILSVSQEVSQQKTALVRLAFMPTALTVFRVSVIIIVLMVLWSHVHCIPSTTNEDLNICLTVIAIAPTIV